MNIWTKRATQTVLMLLLVVALIVASVVYFQLQRYDAAMTKMEPRISRLSGLLASERNLTEGLTAGQTNLSPWVYSGGGEASNQIQQDVRKLVAEAGLTMGALQATYNADANSRLGKVMLTATITGEWNNVLRLITALQLRQPAIWFQSTVITREGGSAPSDPQLTRVSFQLEAPVLQEGAKP